MAEKNTQFWKLQELVKTQSSLSKEKKKCPELISQMFEKILSSHPTERRSIKIHGCLLSQLQCTPLELSSPHGYAKLVKKGKVVQHPDLAEECKPEMSRLFAM